MLFLMPNQVNSVKALKVTECWPDGLLTPDSIFKNEDTAQQNCCYLSTALAERKPKPTVKCKNSSYVYA